MIKMVNISLTVDDVEAILYALNEMNQFYEKQPKELEKKRDYKEIYEEILESTNTAFSVMFQFIQELNSQGHVKKDTI